MIGALEVALKQNLQKASPYGVCVCACGCARVCVCGKDKQNRTNVLKREGGKVCGERGKVCGERGKVCVCVCRCVTRRQTEQYERFNDEGKEVRRADMCMCVCVSHTHAHTHIHPPLGTL